MEITQTLVEEVPGFIQVCADGFIIRYDHKLTKPSLDPIDGVRTRDITINPSKSIWARIFLPTIPNSEKKLPLIIYFHGGGFCIGSTAWASYHEFLTGLAIRSKSVIVSVDYRLAPEHRIPAAYDDCFEALNWVFKSARNDHPSPQNDAIKDHSRAQDGIFKDSQDGPFKDPSNAQDAIFKDSQDGTSKDPLGIFVDPSRVQGDLFKNPSNLQDGTVKNLSGISNDTSRAQGGLFKDPSNVQDRIFKDPSSIPKESGHFKDPSKAQSIFDPSKAHNGIFKNSQDRTLESPSPISNDPSRAQGGLFKDPWLGTYVDFSRCFLAGESAGGNIAHTVGIMASRSVGLVSIKGLIVLQPYFGSQERIECERKAESEYSTDDSMALEFNDTFWRMALPVGANRDHPACNPEAPGAPDLSEIELPPVLVNVAALDLLKARGVMYYEQLKKCGKEAEFMEADGQIHAYHLYHPNSQASISLQESISEFVHRS